jgi:hypothetical protein
MSTGDDNIGNRNPTRAIDILLHPKKLGYEVLNLEELAKEALHDFMKGFGKEERFFDPLLEWTLGNKPPSQIKTLLVTNHWYELKKKNKKRQETTITEESIDQPYEKLIECVAKAASYLPDVRKPISSDEDPDQTLLNLIHPLSPWHKALGKDGNAAAMNQAWGLKIPEEKDPSAPVVYSRFCRAIAVWGRVVLLLREAGAPLSHVILTGDNWRFSTHKGIWQTNQVVPASAYYLLWFIKDWSLRPPQPSNAVTDDLIDPELKERFHNSYLVCKELAQDPHEVRFWAHPGTWSYLDSTIYIPPL